MSRSIVAGIAFAAISIAATAVKAADLSTAPFNKAPVAAYSWNGFYFGGNVGGGWASSSDGVEYAFPGGAFPVGTNYTPTRMTGPVGGLQGGYNWGITSNVLLGVEGDYSWSDFSGTSMTASPTAAGISTSISTKIKDVALATGRVGYEWSNWLFYFKGGAAWGQSTTTGQVFSGGATIDGTSTNANRNGWTFGGGAEWAFLPNWSAKFEYSHIDFGLQPLPCTESQVQSQVLPPESKAANPSIFSKSVSITGPFGRSDFHNHRLNARTEITYRPRYAGPVPVAPFSLNPGGSTGCGLELLCSARPMETRRGRTVERTVCPGRRCVCRTACSSNVICIISKSVEVRKT